jgi:hypothetical protein
MISGKISPHLMSRWTDTMLPRAIKVGDITVTEAELRELMTERAERDSRRPT